MFAQKPSVRCECLSHVHPAMRRPACPATQQHDCAEAVGLPTWTDNLHCSINRPGELLVTHPRTIVETAALLAAHSRQLVESSTNIPTEDLHRYWMLARRNFARWTRQLGRYDISEAATERFSPDDWQQVRTLLSEVFLSEVLVRVWTCLLTAVDKQKQQCHAEPIGRNVLIGHLEIRHRALSFMVNGPSVSLQDLAVIDRLRRRTEHWTDVLLGQMVDCSDVSDFAFDHHRAVDFRSDVSAVAADVPLQWTDAESARWNLILAGLRMAFHDAGKRISPLADEMADLPAAILACFPGESFSAEGPFKSLKLDRILQSSEKPEQRAVFPAPRQPIAPAEVPAAKKAKSNSVISFAQLRNSHLH